jgi:hypothetical protein
MKEPVQRKPHSLRLPEPLQKWLKHQAVDNSRSLTAEITARLEESRTRQLKKEPADAN